MFAYRHAFHAGNHADVFKHLVLICALELLQKKETPLLVVDTHAGAGLYGLYSALVRDKAEWPSGIGKLWQEKNLPELVTRYLTLVRHFNKSGRLSNYPGSPVLIQQLLRPQDKLRAFEMHPSDIGPLAQCLKGAPRQIKAERKDGFQQLRALLPPASRRGLVLIDPPYEMRDDYRHVVVALREAIARFSTGVYMVWYPKIARFQVDRLLRQIAGLPLQAVLHATLTVRGPLKDGLGLQGSGLVVINPPFGLYEELGTVLPTLAKLLAQDAKAGFTLHMATTAADVKTALGFSKPGAVAVSARKT